ncbi:aldo/keto reductase [Eggerthellaceae bacterium zg-887]|uniref:aldo/keto reductase n=1 Tax=Xiamenia xianingshaonis TaxID=2682776 RepID=UPI00140E4425|nr:aldo/keto reductase [Xiamenia xianingshaonis]NHM16628.1 aldo/keto reductase [Xiamenia xianingshaonis]
MEYATLPNGLKMPLEGFGVFQVPDLEECEDSVYAAIKDGYRLIDTASAYANEEAVGAAVRRAVEDGICTRDELFVTTKLWIQDYPDAEAAFELSLKKLGMDYVDLYLLHQPIGDYYTAWRSLEKIYASGKAKAIGVCNFYPERITDLCLHVDVKPMVNQVECHPFFQQTEALQAAEEFGYTLEAWGPLAEGGHGIFTHPVLAAIGEKHGKTAAQVALRFNVQRGIVVIPKSVHEERIKENFDIWDFELTDEDMEAVEALDLGHSEIIDHSDPSTAKFLSSFNIHD